MQCADEYNFACRYSDTYILEMTIANRLDKAMLLAGFKSQSALSRASGVPQPTINRILKGKGTKGPETETVRKLAAACNVNFDWLNEDRGNMARAAQSNVELGPDIRGTVPVVSWITAGHWAEIIDLCAPGVAEEWRPCPRGHGNRTFALRIRGISMENLGGKHSYSHGDIIFVDPDRHAENGSHVIVRLDNEEEATFKQLAIEGNRKFLRALNPAWPEKIIEIDGNATICGVVIGKWTDV